MQKNPFGSEPEFILGFRKTRFTKVMIWFVVSLVAFIVALKLIAIYPEPHIHQSITQNYFTAGFYFTPNMAGVASVVFLMADVSLVISGLVCLVVAFVFFRVGQLDLYEDYAVLKKLGKSTQVTYDQLENLYLGYTSMATSASTPGMYGPYNPSVFMEIASFYIGNRRFTFNINKQPGVAKFLESKVPKANIVVDDVSDDNSGDTSSS